MSKPVINIILPEVAPDSAEALVIVRSMESFRRQMYPFDVILHNSDLDYEKAKNPLWGREAPVYAVTESAPPAGDITVEKDPFHRSFTD